MQSGQVENLKLSIICRANGLSHSGYDSVGAAGLTESRADRPGRSREEAGEVLRSTTRAVALHEGIIPPMAPHKHQTFDNGTIRFSLAFPSARSLLIPFQRRRSAL